MFYLKIKSPQTIEVSVIKIKEILQQNNNLPKVNSFMKEIS
jgi:hypothetical protein